MDDKQHNTRYSNFGFKQQDINKQHLVNDIFSTVAGKYDLMNDLMSLGIHRLWKAKFCEQVTELAANILDMAGGTGDIAFRIKKQANKSGSNRNNHITICDPSEEMLARAKDKAINNNLLEGLSYVLADAAQLPFADNSFDYYTIAFGIRNVAEIDLALKEALRVLKVGGKFLCLEFSRVENEHLKRFYDFYSCHIIPKIGQIITGDELAYQYLVDSISLFPDQENFATMLKQAGFREVNYQNLSFGIVAIHTASKL